MIFQGIATFLNLVSVYQIITIMNSVFQIVKEDLLGRFVEIEQKTFFEHIVYDSFKNLPELEIEFWSSMLGSIILENCKIEISSFILFVINLGCLICLNLFPFHKEEDLQKKYSAFELIELIIFYLILFLSVGGGSLFYYQKFISVFKKLNKLFIPYLKKVYISYFILFISCESMITKIRLDYLIIDKFDYKVNKRKFSLCYFSVYAGFFFLSWVIQIILDKCLRDEIFALKCDCCKKCKKCCECCQKCCKCCQKCCENKINDPITVLRKKVDGCNIFGYVYYEEEYKKTEIERSKFKKEIDYEIKNVGEGVLNINDIELYDDDYSIKIIFKRKNFCDWFSETFNNLKVIFIFTINIFIDLQVMGFTNLYSETLEKMTYKENNKELIKYLFCIMLYGSFFYLFIPFLMFVYHTFKFKKFQIKKWVFSFHFIYVICFYNLLIIIYSILHYNNKLPNKKITFFDFYTISLVTYNLVKIIWMNQIGQKNAKDFLNITGFLSLFNFLNGLLPNLFIEKLQLSIKYLMIIQVVCAILCSVNVFLVFIYIFYNNKYVMFFFDDTSL